MFVHAGSAGTGKSFLAHAISQWCLANESIEPLIAAPTGYAALNANGVTCHAAFGIDGKLRGYEEVRRHFSITLDEALTVIVDEFFLASAELLECMERQSRRFNDPRKFFGGLNLVFFGDPFQGAPVLRFPSVNKVRLSLLWSVSCIH